MSTIKANTLLHSDGSTTTQPSIPALDKRMAHSFITFQGTDTVAILASYNVSSLVDNGTGQYTVNFTTNPSNIYYTSLVSSAENLNNTPWTEFPNQAIGSYQLRFYTGSAYIDVRRIFSLIFST
tara:strand:+ start:389 stop:760 length:372 start_codon:yes stop_codon:yes gene_type:complete